MSASLQIAAAVFHFNRRYFCVLFTKASVFHNFFGGCIYIFWVSVCMYLSRLLFVVFLTSVFYPGILFWGLEAILIQAELWQRWCQVSYVCSDLRDSHWELIAYLQSFKKALCLAFKLSWGVSKSSISAWILCSSFYLAWLGFVEPVTSAV